MDKGGRGQRQTTEKTLLHPPRKMAETADAKGGENAIGLLGGKGKGRKSLPNVTETERSSL